MTATLSTEELQYGNARCFLRHPLWLVAEGYARCKNKHNHWAWRFTPPTKEGEWVESRLLDGTTAWFYGPVATLDDVLLFIQRVMDASRNIPTVAVPLGPSLAEWQALHRANRVEEAVS